MRYLALCVASLLASCASVTVTQVDNHGKADAAAEEGFYVPRLMPYLFVADLPEDQQTPTTPASRPRKMRKGHVGAAAATSTPASSKPPAKASDKSDDKTSAPAATSSDLSFQSVAKSYSIKLVYLPDFKHQQAIRAKSGWFGKASLQLSLVDGTLASLNANSDNTENGEVAKALLTAAITAASGGAAGAPAAGASMLDPNKPGADAQKTLSKGDGVLHPGIYRLYYDEDGVFRGVVKVTGFCSNTGTIREEKLIDKAVSDACF